MFQINPQYFWESNSIPQKLTPLPAPFASSGDGTKGNFEILNGNFNFLLQIPIQHPKTSILSKPFFSIPDSASLILGKTKNG